MFQSTIMFSFFLSFTFSLFLTLLSHASASNFPHLRLDAKSQRVEVITDPARNLSTPSVYWDRVAQDLVVRNAVGPTIASGLYGTMHTAMYDAWAVFDNKATQAIARPLRLRQPRNRPLSLQLEAMHFAAFHVLRASFPKERNIIVRALREFGLINTFGPTRTIGKRAAYLVFSAYSREDGKINESAFKNLPYTSAIDLWREEFVPIDDKNGPKQEYLTPRWGARKTFGVKNGAEYRPPQPEAFLLQNGQVHLKNRSIALQSGETLRVSRRLVGSVINPAFIRQAEEVLSFSRRLDDRKKLMAEFWEDAEGTSTPPGTWMTFGQFVSARDGNSVAEDARMFFALGNAVRDAGIATWNAKRFYHYCRPVRAIRDLGSLGLLGRYSRRAKGFVVRAYSIQHHRVVLMRAEDFETYQTPGKDPSPPFPEFVSGHSAFSAAAAEALRRFPGGDAFGASVRIKKGESRFEPKRTPRRDVVLSWRTFSMAAEEAGVSRLHGGIHFRDGHFFGKVLGKNIGSVVYARAQSFGHGVIS